MCTLIDLLMTGAKSTEYLCKHLECDQEELYRQINLMIFMGFNVDTFEEGGRVYVFIE